MIVFDTETTGLPLPETAPLDNQPKIIEIALVKLDFDLKETDRYETLINPEVNIPAGASAVNNINLKDLVMKLNFHFLLNKCVQ